MQVLRAALLQLFPDLWSDQASRHSALMEGTMRVSEQLCHVWRIGREVRVPDPVVQTFSLGEITLVGWDGGTYCILAE
jgi:hypothetical protein